jgi:hypothetical protein
MSTKNGLILLVVLYTLFSFVGVSIFHNMIVILVAGVLAALVGLAISLVFRGSKA